MKIVIFAVLTSLAMGQIDVHTACLDRPGVIYKIARKEGWYKEGTLPRRLNNPGALVCAHQRGSTCHRSGFARFSTALEGWNALDRDVASKIKHHIKLHKAWEYL